MQEALGDALATDEAAVSVDADGSKCEEVESGSAVASPTTAPLVAADVPITHRTSRKAIVQAVPKVANAASRREYVDQVRR